MFLRHVALQFLGILVAPFLLCVSVQAQDRGFIDLVLVDYARGDLHVLGWNANPNQGYDLPVYHENYPGLISRYAPSNLLFNVNQGRAEVVYFAKFDRADLRGLSGGPNDFGFHAVVRFRTGVNLNTARVQTRFRYNYRQCYGVSGNGFRSRLPGSIAVTNPYCATIEESYPLRASNPNAGGRVY